MFFAKKLIFVEGITEQLLIPIFAEYNGFNLFDNHISIINCNGRFFKPFLELFKETNGINKDIVCITDRDCQKRKYSSNNWNKCYFYELNLIPDDYEYKKCSNTVFNEYNDKFDNIRFYIQEKSHTFEYDLILSNCTCVDLVTEDMSNRDEIKKIITKYDKSSCNYSDLLSLLNDNFKEKIVDCITKNDSLSNQEKCKHLIATRYVNSIKNKGEHAQNLSNILSDKITDDNFEFNIPIYIDEALKWISNPR